MHDHPDHIPQVLGWVEGEWSNVASLFAKAGTKDANHAW